MKKIFIFVFMCIFFASCNKAEKLSEKIADKFVGDIIEVKTVTIEGCDYLMYKTPEGFIGLTLKGTPTRMQNKILYL
jgi:uncharacterized protein YggL (DUF469 family)